MWIDIIISMQQFLHTNVSYKHKHCVSGHHLDLERLKDLDGHDQGPLKNLWKSLDPSPDPHTDLTKSQRKANTDRTSYHHFFFFFYEDVI